ncbi:universal stress protein [Microbacterium pumilum]|uniref:UspA domain-containing protein n=1 Tax=Microbacterium pumilum TaxID=344165 RepID=A0ABP5D7L6_9MICO
MERIVLAYDGSPAAVSALSWTATRATRGPTSVDVVVDIPPWTKDRVPGTERFIDPEVVLRDRLPGLEVGLHRLDGEVTESIARAANNADLVVVGINPGHPIRAAATGWIPLGLSTLAAAPVCMIPVGWTEGNDPVTVGIADDYSSDAALRFAVAEATSMATGLRLVHSWLMPGPTFDTPAALTLRPEAVIDDHRHRLDAAVQLVREEVPTQLIQSELIRDSRSAALLRFVSRSSLLVMGTHRRGALIGSLLGSVAQEILWRAECPICVVPTERTRIASVGVSAASPVSVDSGE